MLSTNYNFPWTLELSEEDEEYEVYFTYYPASRGSREKISGLLLSPDEPTEITITSIVDSEGKDHYSLLFPLYSEKLEEAAWEYLEKLRAKDY